MIAQGRNGIVGQPKSEKPINVAFDRASGNTGGLADLLFTDAFSEVPKYLTEPRGIIMGLLAMVTELVCTNFSIYGNPNNHCLVPKKGWSVCRVRGGQYGAKRMINFKRYGLVSFSVFSTLCHIF